MISPQVAKENLEGRQAKCQCGEVKPSSRDLGMFEYRGPGSTPATSACAQCGYYEVAHDRTRVPYNPRICLNFRAHGAYEFDLFWDGCGNTD